MTNLYYNPEFPYKFMTDNILHKIKNIKVTIAKKRFLECFLLLKKAKIIMRKQKSNYFKDANLPYVYHC